MKKLFTILLTLGVSVLSFASRTAVDGIYYDFNTSAKTATVTYQGSTYDTDYYSGEVVVPEQVTYRNVNYRVVAVGDYAFANSTKLTKVSFAGNSVLEIKGSAFRNCPALVEVNLPSSVTTLGTYVFYACKSLTTVVIPESVKTVGQGLFEYCTNLYSVDFSDQIEYLGTYTFQFCESLYSVKLPANLKAIDNALFSNCKSLHSISIPSKVSSIGEYAFRECESLSSVVFEGTAVTKVMRNAFIDCGMLQEIKLPQGLVIIEAGAFSGCKNMKTAWLPASLGKIDKKAFADCSMLEAIYCQAVTPPQIYNEQVAFNNTFVGVDAETPVYVPCGSEDIYRREWTCFNNFLSYDFGGFRLTVLPKEGYKPGYAAIIENATCENPSYTIQAFPGTGYQFAGWDDNGSLENPRVVTLTADATITARFERKNIEDEDFTASFYVDNKLYESITLKANEEIKAPEDPVKECAEFKGWLRADIQKMLADYNTMPAADLRLDAQFETRETLTYTVTCDEKQGSVKVEEKEKPTCEKLHITLEAVANKGFKFVRWSDGNTDNPREITATENIVLRAVFEETIIEENTYTVKIYKNKSLFETLSEVAEGTSLTELLNAYLPSDDNCETFVEWSLLDGSELPEKVMQDLDVNITTNARYYTLIYYLYNLEAASFELIKEESVACGSKIVPLEQPQAGDGYTFYGWIGMPDDLVMPSHNLIVYGTFVSSQEQLYVAKFFVDDYLKDFRLLKEGDPVVAPEDPVKGCFEFAGWLRADNGELLTPDDVMPAYDLRLDARFGNEMSAPEYSIIYDKEQGYIIEHKKPTCSDWTLEVEAVARTGYKFVGWSDQNTEARRTFELADNFKIEAYFAIDESQLTEYKVRFFVDGKLFTWWKLKAGELIEAPEDEPEKECGTFQGWQYIDAAAVRMLAQGDKMPESDVNLTAVFDMQKTPEYSVVSSNDAQGTVVVLQQPSCTNDWQLSVRAVAFEGYEFVGWSDDNNDNPRTLTVTDGLHLVANFSPVGQEDIRKYTVIISVNDDVMGTVEKKVHFEGKAAEGAKFSQWQPTGETVNPKVVELTDANKNTNITYIAEFVSDHERNLMPAQFRHVSSNNGKIDILGQNGKNVDIYNSDGRLVYSGKARAGIVVPKAGKYILRLDGRLAVIDVK